MGDQYKSEGQRSVPVKLLDAKKSQTSYVLRVILAFLITVYAPDSTAVHHLDHVPIALYHMWP
jgi:hypothetical protein